jgi:peptide/nickel transport system substrate-binding protein
MKHSAVVPLILGLGMFAAACGPAAGPAAGGAATAAPATQAPAAAAKPTTAPAAQATTAPAAAAQPTTAAAQPTAAAAAKPTTAAAQPTTAAAQPTSASAAATFVPGKPGGTLTIATQRDATTFDPTKSQDVYSNDILSLVCDTLFEVDDKGQVVGRLVDKVDNPDPTTYIFTLHPGIKFQDGTDFNSDAVKFNMMRHMNDPKSTTIQDWKPISTIDTPDPMTVKITLSQPFAPFLSRLTTGLGFIQSPAAVQKLGDNLQRDLTGAGSGPYKFVSWDPDNQIVLERNPDFWRKDANGTTINYADKIIFKPFPDENVRLANVKTGDAQAMAGNPPFKDVASLQTTPDLTLNTVPGLGFQFLFLNTSKAPFDNPAVRRALAYSIDRDQLVQAVNFGNAKPLTLPMPQSIPWAYMSSSPYDKRDIDKAKQELTGAGVSGPINFSLQISNASPQLQQVAELVKDQIKDAGFEMDIQLIEFATIVQNGNTGDYQALSLGWSGSVDPDGNTYPLFYTGSGFNFAKYSSPDLDKALDAGRTNLDQAKRAQAYMDAQKVLLQDQPMVVLYSENQITTVRNNVMNWPNNYNGWFGGRDYNRAFLSQ